MSQRRFVLQARIITGFGHELVIILERGDQQVSLGRFGARNASQPVGHANPELVDGAARLLEEHLRTTIAFVGFSGALLRLLEGDCSSRLFTQHEGEGGRPWPTGP